MIHHLGITPKQITARSPWLNGVAERFVSTARSELLDHVIVRRCYPEAKCGPYRLSADGSTEMLPARICAALPV